jgi:integrase/recombinase XerC
MRLSEVSKLQVADVELPGRISKEPGSVGAAHVMGKGRKARTVTLNWKACRAVRSYLAVRPSGTDDPRLFLTKFKLRIGPRSIELLVSKYLQEAGILGASVHTPRHTFGTHSVKRGTNLRVIQAELSRSSMSARKASRCSRVITVTTVGMPCATSHSAKFRPQRT